MLMKISLGNVEILNREEVIKQLQEGRNPHLILKPTWYAEYATVTHLFSVPGWTLEDFEANDALQSHSVFLKGNGEISVELNHDDVKEEDDDVKEEDDDEDDDW